MHRASKDEPHVEALPAGADEHLNLFQKVLLTKVFREEKVIFACAHYVDVKLGKEFTEPAPWTLDDVFPDTSSSTPIIFILSSGTRAAAAPSKGCRLHAAHHLLDLWLATARCVQVFQ